MELSKRAREAIRNGSIKLRVTRTGMIQQLTFTVKKARLGNIEYTELFTERMIDAAEISRIANEIGLPIEAQNGKAFPKGTSAQDFRGL